MSLNNFCNNKENKLVLENSSSPRSAGIATATQLRDRRGSIGCGYEFEAKESMGLIVSVVDMNLRAGVLNESCTDYITVRGFIKNGQFFSIPPVDIATAPTNDIWPCYGLTYMLALSALNCTTWWKYGRISN